MSLLTALRAGVKVADKVTKPLQATVTFYRCTTENADSFGARAYAEGPVSMRAIVEGKQQQVRTPAGVMDVSRAKVMFLDINALVAATKGNGVQDVDKIVLADGTTGPILALDGFEDAGTTLPIATQVYIG